jgi:hypothetical protein
MVVGTMVCQLLIPGCRSLKEKRSQIKPLIARIHRKYNVSVSEVDKQDMWNEAVIACSLVSNDHRFSEKSFASIVNFIENYWKNVQLTGYKIEFY